MIIEPLGERVLVLPEVPKDKTKGGLYLPEGARKAIPRAEVKAIGPDVKDLKVGDTVIFEEFGNMTQVESDGNLCLLLSVRNLLAKAKV